MPEPVRGGQRYLPGLDGLRALAVLAVLAYHLGLGWAPGGLLGVGVFFTLSGYLITDLLLGQYAQAGSLKLLDFWLRRARRLLPALFVLLAVVIAWVALLHRPQLAGLRGAVAAAAAYVSNWYLIGHHTSYFAPFGPPSPLGHLWSLAVEEQFYLVWPWLLLLGLAVVAPRRGTGSRAVTGTGAGGRYGLAVVTLALAGTSAAAMTMLYHPGYDPTRVYDGTDTRAFALLIGAALAFAWPTRQPRRDVSAASRWCLDGVGFVGLLVIAALVWRTTEYSPFMYRGGLAVLSLATVLVLAAVAAPAGRLGPLLGAGPLRWIGVRSYGIYLWHFPIIALTTPAGGRDPASRAALQVAATIAVAALSWRFIEEPIRHGALSRWWSGLRARPARGAAPGAAHGAAHGGAHGAAYGAAHGAGQRSAHGAGQRSAHGAGRGAAGRLAWRPAAGLAGGVGALALAGVCLAGVIPALPASLTHPAPPPAAAGPAGHPDRVTGPRSGSGAGSSSGHNPQQALGPGTAGRPRTSCQSVVHIGDSTSDGLISAAYLPKKWERITAQYKRVGLQHVHLEISGARSIVETWEGQPNARTVAEKLKAEDYNGCWVLALGTNDTADVYVGSPVGLAARIKEMMSVIGNQPVMWVNVISLPEAPVDYSESQMQLWNQALTRSCARYPNLRVFDWAAAAKPQWFISDGIHYTSAGYAARSRLIARALAAAFPAGSRTSAAPGSSCVVQ
ncbi:MAG TPA: acyltransferase family protein [Streptosporangiaceae bacterium]|nr:acyltransferase family protein [Streptosporangiaceae bacterium]